MEMSLCLLLILIGGANAVWSDETQMPTFVQACVYDQEPYVSCDPVTRQVLDGFSISLWETMATNLRLTYNYTCRLHASNTEADMNAGVCDIALGMTATSARLTTYEWDFSPPTLTTGWAIMARRHVGDSTTIRLDGSAFKFFNTFDYTLWVAVIVTMVGTALMISFVEGLNANSEEFPRGGPRGLWEGTWAAASTMLTLGTDKPIVTVPGRIIQLMWQFMMLIVVSSYTANLASLLTAATAQSTISGPADLAGQVVMADQRYQQGLLDVGAIPILIDVETDADVVGMFTPLLNYNVRALVGDRAAFQYYSKSNCSLYTVPGDWNTEYNGLAFPRNTSTLFRSTISNEIVTLSNSGDLAAIISDTIGDPSDDPCAANSDDGDTFSWFDLRGLWFIYCFGVAALVLILLALMFAKQRGIADVLTFLSPQGLPDPDAEEPQAPNALDINQPGNATDQTPKLLYSVLVELRELRSTVEKQQAQLTFLTQHANSFGRDASVADGMSVYEGRTQPPHAKLF